MKTLAFTAEKKHIYEILYESAAAAPVKGATEINTSAGVLRKFKAHGFEKSEDEFDKKFHLRSISEDCTIELEDAEFKFLKERFETTPWTNSVRSEMLQDVLEFLEEAGKRKKEKES